MIKSKTPYRISFVGGGTDLPSFYREHGGEVISTTIDKYITVTVGGNLFNLSQNPHITTVLAETGVDMSVHISIESDMPIGSGLGGSSALTVGLLSALHAYKNVGCLLYTSPSPRDS